MASESTNFCSDRVSFFSIPVLSKRSNSSLFSFTNIWLIQVTMLWQLYAKFGKISDSLFRVWYCGINFHLHQPFIVFVDTNRILFFFLHFSFKKILEEESKDLASQMFPPRLFVVHDSTTGCQNDVSVKKKISTVNLLWFIQQICYFNWKLSWDWDSNCVSWTLLPKFYCAVYFFVKMLRNSEKFVLFW